MKRGDFLFELFIFGLEMGNSLDERLYGCLYFLVDWELHRFIFIKIKFKYEISLAVLKNIGINSSMMDSKEKKEG